MKSLFVVAILFSQLSHASSLPASLAEKTFVCTKPGSSDVVASFKLGEGFSGQIRYKTMTTGRGIQIEYSPTSVCPFRLCTGHLKVGASFDLIVLNSIDIDLVLTGNHIGHGLLSFDNNGRLYETDITCIPQK
jgi:hypothetical protein